MHKPLNRTNTRHRTVLLLLLEYLSHTKIDRFFFPPCLFYVCTAVADQTRPGPGLSGHSVCLYAALNKPHSSALPGQTERQTEKKTDRVLPCPRTAFCMQSAEAVCLSRSLAECLCNWTLRWSSLNHGRIIKRCWSPQSWERGRFINDTLTTARGLREQLRNGNIAWNHWLDCHLPAGPCQCEWSFM